MSQRHGRLPSCRRLNSKFLQRKQKWNPVNQNVDNLFGLSICWQILVSPCVSLNVCVSAHSCVGLSVCLLPVLKCDSVKEANIGLVSLTPEQKSLEFLKTVSGKYKYRDRRKDRETDRKIDIQSTDIQRLPAAQFSNDDCSLCYSSLLLKLATGNIHINVRLISCKFAILWLMSVQHDESEL